MEKVQFAVSAKTARLIGRENIAGVDGALIELIKNSYDADARCSFVLFYLPFPSVLKKIPFTLAAEVFQPDDYNILLSFYEKGKDEFIKKDSNDIEQEQTLSSFLFSFNRILVIDNGEGMSEETLRTSWMNIGTNDKDDNRVSKQGRIKTGAKGIGRFALDKLSVQTTVITKSKNSNLLRWKIDWNQFETASMLNEISASIDILPGDFSSFSRDFASEYLKSYDQYNWDTGTIIILEPIREPWSSEYFLKLNSSLRSLFFDSSDYPFDTYVYNYFYPELSFENDRFDLSDEEYDYKIEGTFDGKDTIHVAISRNEIDIRKRNVPIIVSDNKYNVSLSDFWGREKFKFKDFQRSDFSKVIEKSFSAREYNKKDNNSAVGPFHAVFYFLKNRQSNYQIVKRFNDKNRKELLNHYSGVKLYRDGFKVRPYGDDGPAYDWLGLGERARKSPGGVGTSEAWRVRTNQILGYVKISKENNPNLTDMANREGLSNNEAFYSLIDLLVSIIETFEGDRQYFFREYASWYKAKIEEYSKTPQVIDFVDTSKTIDGKKNVNTPSEEKEFSESDYKEAILELNDERIKKDRAMKTMMLYSSSGVMTSTFSHEINRIMTNVGSRMQHLKFTIDRLIGEEGYKGAPIFDPYLIIQQSEEIDTVLESWLSVIIRGAGSSSFVRNKKNIYLTIEKIIELWKPLLKQKIIEISLLPIDGLVDDANIVFADADLYIILNNFILNAAWFLEQSKHERRITVSVINHKDYVEINLTNNGPTLDKKFSNNPDRVFNPGETSKVTADGEGTGLGLWIVKMIVEDLSGTIGVIEMEDGFGIRIKLGK